MCHTDEETEGGTHPLFLPPTTSLTSRPQPVPPDPRPLSQANPDVLFSGPVPEKTHSQLGPVPSFLSPPLPPPPHFLPSCSWTVPLQERPQNPGQGPQVQLPGPGHILPPSTSPLCPPPGPEIGSRPREHGSHCTGDSLRSSRPSLCLQPEHWQRSAGAHPGGLESGTRPGRGFVTLPVSCSRYPGLFRKAQSLCQPSIITSRISCAESLDTAPGTK